MRVELEIDTAKIHSLSVSIAIAHNLILSGMGEEAQDSASDIERAARTNALRKLPRRGGLAADVASSRFRRKRSRESLEVVASSSYDLQGMDEGQIVHPTFGHRPWVTQSVQSGWFSDSLEDAEEEYVDSVNELVARAINRIR